MSERTDREFVEAVTRWREEEAPRSSASNSTALLSCAAHHEAEAAVFANQFEQLGGNDLAEASKRLAEMHKNWAKAIKIIAT